MVLYQQENSVLTSNLDIRWYDNFSYTAHFHGNFELVYVKEGTLEVFVGEKRQEAKTGELVLVLPNQIHSYESPLGSRCWVGVFSPDYAREFYNCVSGLVSDGNVFRIEGVGGELVRSRLIEAALSRLEYQALFSYVCAVFYSMKSFSRRGAEDGKLFSLILEYIQKNAGGKISQRQMAKDLGYEPHYLSGYLNRFFQSGFNDLLNRTRIDNAKQLMQNGEKSLSRIAMESGFGSIRSFNRAWQLYEKEEPRQTQKRLTGGESNIFSSKIGALEKHNAKLTEKS